MSETLENKNGQQYPLRLIDRVLSVQLGESAEALKNVSFNEQVMVGHFPGNPILPAIYIVEGICQTCQLFHDSKTAVTAKLESFRFKFPVVPGDQIHFKAKRISTIGNFVESKGWAYVNGKIAAEGTVIGMSLPEPTV